MQISQLCLSLVMTLKMQLLFPELQLRGALEESFSLKNKWSILKEESKIMEMYW